MTSFVLFLLPYGCESYLEFVRCKSISSQINANSSWPLNNQIFDFDWNLTSDWSNYVQSSMSYRSKPKIGCWSSISKRWTRSSLFNVWKNGVRFCSMFNLVKAFWVWCSMSVRLKPKFRCSSLIINRWILSSSFDVRKMMLELVRCSIRWCSTYHYIWLQFDSSLTYKYRLNSNVQPFK